MIRYADASVVVASIARQPASALVDPILNQIDDRVIFSDFAMAECSSALARLGRVDRWSKDLHESVFAELDGWAHLMTEAVVIASEDIAFATAAVRQHGTALRAPDAIHIAAAHRLGATLLTLDKGMVRAAAALGVPHYNPADADASGEPKD